MKRIKIRTVAVALIGLTIAGIGNQIKFIPNAATVKFQVFTDTSKDEKRIVEADGVITGLMGGVSLDSISKLPNNITASVNVATINTGVDLRDESLRSKDFFEASKYPTITFSSSIIKKEAEKYFAEGDLKIKNVIKKIIIPFELIAKADTCFYKGSFTINRCDYKVGTKDDGIGKEVAIEFSLPILKN